MKKIFKSNSKKIMLTVIFCLLEAIVNVYASFFLSNIFNGLQDRDLNKILTTSITILLLFLTAGLTTYFKNVMQAKAVASLTNSLRVMISNKIISSSYEEFYKKDSGNYVSWFTNDSDQIEGQVFENIFNMINFLFISVFSFIALMKLSAALGPIAIVLFLVMFFVPKLATQNLEKLSLNRSKSLENFMEKMKETIMGYDIFYTYGLLSKFTNVVDNNSNILETEKFKYKKHLAKINFKISFANIVCQMILILATVYLVYLGKASAGAVVSVTGVGGSFFQGVISAINSSVSIKSAKPIIKKFTIIEKKLNLDNDYESDIESIATKSLKFSYDDGGSCIEYPDMNFERGKKYILKGTSGSGKSTLIKILMGLLSKYTGNIIINGKISNKSFIKKISYIPQNVYLFNTTLRENITLGANYSEEEIKNAISIAALDDFVENNGLDVTITENGKNLSGGQRQRIAIARAFIRGSKYLFIDEGTSALDKETSLKVEHNLLDQKDCTVIFITHNLHDECMSKIEHIYSLT